MTKLRAVIVEDVALMRNALLTALEAHADVAVVGVADSLSLARTLLAEVPCDVLFLDVHLPDGHGVTLADRSDTENSVRQIVYCTADPNFALDAIRQEAADYLLKPVTPEALARALDRVRQRHGVPQRARPPLEIRDGSRVRFIAPALVERVEAAGHYQCVHAGGEVHLIRQSSAQLAEQLGPGFVRVHRAHLVRVDAIRAITTERSGDGSLTLESGAVVRFSRGFRAQIEDSLAQA